MDVHKTIGHRHSHHGHKKHSSTLCSSIPKIWMVIQNILATDDRRAWKSLTQDADHIIHIKNALLMSRMSNDASLLPASSKHKVLQFEQPRRMEAQVRFGRAATDLNALQVAMFHRNEALACQIINFLRLHADPRELASFLNHVWGNKNTSLHLACFQAMPRLVKLLMELGASTATVNGRRLTPAECCKDPECLARLALPTPQPMAPITITKKRAPVAHVPVARSPTTNMTTTTATTSGNVVRINNSTNDKRPLSETTATMTARQVKPSPVVRASAASASIVLDSSQPATRNTANVVVVVVVAAAAAAAAAVSLPTTASSVQVRSESPEPMPAQPASAPVVEPSVPPQSSASSLSVTVHQGSAPKTVSRPGPPPSPPPLALAQAGGAPPLPSLRLLLPAAPPPPSVVPQPERIHGTRTAFVSHCVRPGLDPTATMRPQPQNHSMIPTPSADPMTLAREVPEKSGIVPAPVKDPSDPALLQMSAFYLGQVIKALDCHHHQQQQRHHRHLSKEDMLLVLDPLTYHCNPAIMATLTVGHVYREQALCVP